VALNTITLTLIHNIIYSHHDNRGKIAHLALNNNCSISPVPWHGDEVLILCKDIQTRYFTYKSERPHKIYTINLPVESLVLILGIFVSF
jgi:hypothetical protein